MSFGPNPWHQTSWDARAAGNFMAGGAGSGLIVAAALGGGPAWLFLAGAAIVGIGLMCVWAEIGRPWRALNVFFHPRTSWMTREAIVAQALMLLALAAALGVGAAAAGAALVALAFVYCQGRILRAARGIPAWREPTIVPLIAATGLAEGFGLWLLLAGRLAPLPAWVALAAALLARQWLWGRWRARIQAAPRAHAAIDAAGRAFQAGTLLALALAGVALLAPLPPAAAWALQAAAGLAALAAGLWFKFTLVTRAAFNQGFALPHLPVRGARRS
ncbi:MAG TPA: hypothetical protein PKB14_20565 [Rubrivivax sp.]|nr:hypothetical protein [Rubrivivax sp.]